MPLPLRLFGGKERKEEKKLTNDANNNDNTSIVSDCYDDGNNSNCINMLRRKFIVFDSTAGPR